MLEAKDTLSLKVLPSLGLKKSVTGNMLFLQKRCRSRSFTESPDLLPKSSEDSFDDDDNYYGVGYDGQIFEFKPQDYSITKNYEEIKLLFQDTLSPTVVTLTKSLQTDMVSYC